jgi:hypothetical protein
MGPAPTSSKPKPSESSAPAKSASSGKPGGKVDSPFKSGRDALMKISAERSPPSKGPGTTEVVIQRIVTGTFELVAVLVFLATYAAHQFLNDRNNFFGINGERLRKKCAKFLCTIY